jgi:respiratory burst oxidase
VSGHTVCHIVDYVNEADPNRNHLWKLANGDEPQPNIRTQLSRQVVITGVTMLITMALAYPFALKIPNNLLLIRNHNWFYGTHHLFVLFYASLLIHPKPAIPDEEHEWDVSDTWVFVCLPILIYLLERIARGLRRRLWKAKILTTVPHQNNVVQIMISRPRNFKYKAGQYIMIRLPTISLFEWHPYSLTSCPYDNYLSVFIKQNGDWSMDVCNKLCNNQDSKYPPIIIDGPFGAPAQNYSKFSIVLLVGAGIGITPFVSIIQDLICWSRTVNQTFFKVHFHWVIKDIADLEWFHDFLVTISSNDILETTVWITRNYNNFLEDKVSPNLNLKQGRPDWDEIFRMMNITYNNTIIGVFYCGPSALAKILSKKSVEQTTNCFKFHMEHF